MISAVAIAGPLLAALPLAMAGPLPAQGLEDRSSPSLWIHTAERPFPENPGGYARYTDVGMSSIIGRGALIGLYLSCTPAGPACAPDRAAELHVIRSGKRTVVRAGVIADFVADGKTWDTYETLKTAFPSVDTSASAALEYQFVVPSSADLGELRSNTLEFDVRRPTTVRFTVINGTWERFGYAAGVQHYCVRKTTTKVPTIVMRISPARAGRIGFLVYGEDRGSGDRVITEQIVSDRRGVFRFPGPDNFRDSRLVRVPAVNGLAGVSTIFDPCSPSVAQAGAAGP